MLKLKQVLVDANQTQRALAKSVQLSPACIAQLINYDQWPKHRDRQQLRECILQFLEVHGAANDESIFEELKEPLRGGATALVIDSVNNQSQEDAPMLLRKQVLAPATKKAFGFFRNPFDELQSVEDMWVSPDIRYVRESMYQTAVHGGFLAVIGESGAGKSTLRRDLANRIMQNNDSVILIEPYVLAAEDNDIKGKTLKSTHIAEAMMAAIAPLAAQKSSPEARFAQLHKSLKDSHAAGYKHCLVIEEAHSLPIPTLKHLKRILELENGFTKLVSIILIGQPELGVKLSERNADVREVVQLCEIIHLQPIEDALLHDFLKFRFDRVNKALNDVIDSSGIQALTERLSMKSRTGGRDNPVSILYPLAIGNLVIASLNLAATLGVPVITDDIVKGV